MIKINESSYIYIYVNICKKNYCSILQRIKEIENAFGFLLKLFLQLYFAFNLSLIIY